MFFKKEDFNEKEQKDVKKRVYSDLFVPLRRLHGFAAVFIAPQKTAKAEEGTRKVVYSDFSALPSDWKVYEKSDTYEGHTTTFNSDGRCR